jgi:hypothetical protein
MSIQHTKEIMPEVLERYSLKPIPTNYKGCQFRSRIEARWAVFLDALGLRWDYEPEGFDLGGVKYLPDFLLPKMGVWIEIKGADPQEDECEKAHRLAVASGRDVFVFFGGHTLPDGEHGPPLAYWFGKCGNADHGYAWCECRTCHSVGIAYQGRADRLPCKACVDRTGCPRSDHGDKGINTASTQLVNAYRAARAARFGT